MEKEDARQGNILQIMVPGSVLTGCQNANFLELLTFDRTKIKPTKI